MNTLFLIGNGFDLAHGHQTAYSNFIYWYLNSIVVKHSTSKTYKDEMIEVSRRAIPRKFNVCDAQSIIDFHDYYHPLYKHVFIEKIISKCVEANWVDIEEEYYMLLKLAYKSYKDNQNMLDILTLNESFAFLKNKLIDYLRSIQAEFTPRITIKRLLDNEMSQSISSAAGTKPINLFLNFNYTELIKHYTLDHIYSPTDPEPFSINTIVNIHGELLNPGNPIIFGYGDEMDEHYSGIENINKNEFLKHIKSFGYLRTDNYERLINFIKSEIPYRVVVLGHSCGISDRVLLNTIFDNKYCRHIKIYYYAWGNENDFTEKTMNISRHFRKEHKADVRDKIINFKKSSTLE